MPGRAAKPLTAFEAQPPQIKKPVVIGIYGIPGCGKTFLLNQLKQTFEPEWFKFYDGSQVIAAVVPGGLNSFQKLEEQEQIHWREVAIEKIGQDCAARGGAAVVAGHFMFWAEGAVVGRPVYTNNDMGTYTHILYLDFPADVVAQRRQNDTERCRPSTTVDHLRKWQQEEKDQLCCLCRQHGILFSLVAQNPSMLSNVSALLRNFYQQSEEHNLESAEIALDEALFTEKGHLKTLLVLDADRTLTAEDTGSLFWKRHRDPGLSLDEPCRLRALFGSALGYSYVAFRQAALLYEGIENYEALCQDVASTVAIHPEFISLLQLVAGQDHIRTVVISCGIRRIWELVLQRAGLSGSVKVLAGNRISDGYVVTSAVKAALVARSRNVHKLSVWAFGDSVLDLGMLKNANRAIVVVGDQRTRSKTMDAELGDAIDNGGLRAHQVLLPKDATPRLNTTNLPLIQLTNASFVAALIGQRKPNSGLSLFHATKRVSANLLMTPMRDATVAGPRLREAHWYAGWYLATELLSEVIGVEEYPIPHVQGHMTSGCRLLHERQTMIVALMRGGEAMAFGVNAAFPLATFLHARCPEDVTDDLLTGKVTVVLVDSVINSGKTVVQFVQHIRSLHATIRIVVVAGVIQTQCMSEGLETISQDGQLSLVALRHSDNKFTGRGGTDTGNRLFNTTYHD